MSRAIVAATLWILAGLTLLGVLYWTFLNTPESTTVTLATSLLLVLLMYVTTAITAAGLVLGWARGWTWATLRRSASGIAAGILPLALVGATSWLVGLGLAWIDGHAGEIGAWFIATFDQPDVSWLLAGVRYAGDALRFVLVPFAALVWLAQLVDRGARPLVDRATLSRAGHPLRWLAVFAVVAAAIWAPVRYGLYWMPSGLPPTWIEPAVAVVKFGVLAVVAAIGLALIGALAARPGR